MRETVRLSNSPIFVVGIYSGADQLGEGFGSSLKMAEYRVSSLFSDKFYPLMFFIGLRLRKMLFYDFT